MKTQSGIIEGWKYLGIKVGSKGEYVLSSPITGQVVAPRRINTARHQSHQNGVMLPPTPGLCPHREYRCGFNILRYPISVDSDILFDTVSEIDIVIIARVWGWGITIPGTRGFRCQYFYPKSIVGIFNARLESRYNTLPQISNPEIKKRLWKIARLYKIKAEWEELE